MTKSSSTQIRLNDVFPESGRVLLTGGGKEFVERIGTEAARKVILNVLLGQNIRTQTEPLTRRRIAQVCGAIVALFANAGLRDSGFVKSLSQIAVDAIQNGRGTDKATKWIAQWIIGLTGKSVQNVLRSDPEQRDAYIAGFEAAIVEAATKCREEYGDVAMTLGYREDKAGRITALDWNGITRLTTAIGCAALTIRGSDKSIYGKLFERLILGSVLSILGFECVRKGTSTKTSNIFWLSDASDIRECDATLVLKPGSVARFDIGFIGPGNSEISKDKLSRFTAELELGEGKHYSRTFIVVDRLPATSKTLDAATRLGAEIVQMSMQYWPRELACHLGKWSGWKHPLQSMPDSKIAAYLAEQLAPIKIQNFVTGVSAEDIEPANGEEAE